MKALNLSQVLKVILFYLLMTIPFLGMILSGQSENAPATATTYEAILQKAFDGYQSGAAAIVTKGDEVLYKGAIGYANMELGVEMKPEHVFRIGSITKQFTAVAIMQLEEQGKLSIQDPITKFIPDYPSQGKTITVEHLLTHTSGIKSYTNMEVFESMFRKDLSPMEIVDVFKDEPMEFAPGEQFNYNNSGYILLGVIIEKVSGLSYADYIQQHIFDQVGMQNSYYGNFGQIIPNRAAGYQGRKENYQNADYLSMTLPYAAGSLLSNVDDLHKWIQAIHAHKLVSKKSLEKAFSPYKLTSGEFSQYGYGWGLGNMYDHPVIEHGGGINGFLTASMYLPDDEIFVAVFSNCNCKDPEETANKLAALAIGELKNLTKVTVDEATLDQYVGIYETEEGRQHKMVRENQQLFTMSRGGNRYELFPLGKDEFFFKDEIRTVRFVRNDNGEIAKVRAYERGTLQGEAQRTAKEVVVEKAISLPLNTLKEYLGSYDMGPFKLHFTLEDGKLFGKPDGDEKAELVAKAKDEFFLKVVDAQVSFIRENGKVKSVKVVQGQAKLQGDRLNENTEAKAAVSAPAMDLQKYTGVYETEGQQLTVTLEDGYLYGQPGDDSKEKMIPKAKDRFEVKTLDGDHIKIEFKWADEKVKEIHLLLDNGNEMVGKKIK